MGKQAITIEGLIMRDGLKCHYCGILMNVYHNVTKEQHRDPRRFTFEHIVPRRDGGTYGYYNIVGACNKCNSLAGADRYKCFCGFCQNARAKAEMRAILKVTSP